MKKIIFTILFVILSSNIKVHAFYKHFDQDISPGDLNKKILTDEFLTQLIKSIKNKNEINFSTTKNYTTESNTQRINDLIKKEKELEIFLLKYDINSKENFNYMNTLRKIINLKLEDYKSEYIPIKTLSSITLPITKEDKKKKLIFKLDINNLLDKINLVEIYTKEQTKNGKLISSIIKKIVKGSFTATNLGECVYIKNGNIIYYQLSFYKYFPFKIEKKLKEEKSNYKGENYSYIMYDTTLKDDTVANQNFKLCNNITSKLPSFAETKENFYRISSIIDKVNKEAQKEVDKIYSLKKEYPECENFDCVRKSIKKEINNLNQKILSGEKTYIEERTTTEIKETIKQILESIINNFSNDIAGMDKYIEDTLSNYSNLKVENKNKTYFVTVDSVEIQPYQYIDNGNTKIGVFTKFKYKIKEVGSCSNMVEGHKIVKIGNYKIDFVKINNKYISSVEIPFKVLKGSGNRKWDFINKKCFEELANEGDISDNKPIVCIKDINVMLKYLSKISNVNFDIPDCKYMISLITCNGKYEGNICEEEGCYHNFGEHFVNVDYKKSLNSLGLYNLIGNAYEACRSEGSIECIGGAIIRNNYITEPSDIECIDGITGIRVIIKEN